MSSPDDMVGASAVDSCAAVEAYETGRAMGKTDRTFGESAYCPLQATGAADWPAAELQAYMVGYEHGWASDSVDSSPVTDPRSKPRDPAHRPPS